jgi:hypothetical protein
MAHAPPPPGSCNHSRRRAAGRRPLPPQNWRSWPPGMLHLRFVSTASAGPSTGHQRLPLTGAEPQLACQARGAIVGERFTSTAAITAAAPASRAAATNPFVERPAGRGDGRPVELPPISGSPDETGVVWSTCPAGSSGGGGGDGRDLGASGVGWGLGRGDGSGWPGA